MITITVPVAVVSRASLGTADIIHFDGGAAGQLLTWDSTTTTNSAWKSALGLGEATPAVGGTFVATMAANGATGVRIKRFTDTAPTGYFAQFQTAAGALLSGVEATYGAFVGFKDQGGEKYNVKAYGVLPTNTATVNNANFIAMLAVVPLGGRIYVPLGRYPILGGITFPIAVTLEGASMTGTVFEVAASVGATTDIFIIEPALATSYVGYEFRNFTILPASGTPGRHAIHLSGVNSNIQQLRIDNVRLVALGGKSIYGDGSGLSQGVPSLALIQNSWVYAGVSLTNAGDDVQIINNHFTGTNGTLDVTFLGGTSALLFERNHVLANGGIYVGGTAGNAVFVKVVDNFLEFATGTANSAMVDLDGSATWHVTEAVIACNTFQTIAGTVDGIRLNYVDRAYIGGRNRFTRGAGASKDIRILANATDTCIGDNVWSSGGPTTDMISDAGVRTVTDTAYLGARAVLGKLGVNTWTPTVAFEVAGTAKVGSDGRYLFVANATSPTSYTGANYDRLRLGFESNVAVIGVDAGGTGTVRSLQITTGGNPGIIIDPAGVTTINLASLGTGYLSTRKTAGTTGVTANLLVKIDATGNVVTAALGDVGVLGIAASTAASTVQVEIATRGIINGVADNTTVIGNLLGVGTSTAGRVRDLGVTDSTGVPENIQVIGKANSVATVGNAVSVQLYGPGHYGVQTLALTGDVTRAAGSSVTVLANIPTATPAAGSVVFAAITAPATPAAVHLTIWGDSTDLRFHDKNAAGTIGTTVVADVGASNNFLTAISASGVISKAQPAFTNLSGSVAASQMPALTGDVTTSAGAVATTLANVPSGTPHAGSVLFTAIAAPGTPAAGKGSVYVDSTSKNLAVKNDAGVVNHGIQSVSGLIADDGSITVNGSTGGFLRASGGTPAFGAFGAVAMSITGTGGSGFLELAYNAATAPAASTLRLYGSTAGALAWQTSPGFQAALDATGITAARTYTLPNASGTLALTASPTFTGTVTAAALAVTGMLTVNASGVQIARGTGTLANGANANVAVSANTSYMTFTGPTGAYSVSGFANPADGRILYVYFNVAQTLTLTHDATSTSGQRLTLPGGVDKTFTANTPVRAVFVYDQSVGAGVGYWVLFSAVAVL